MTSPIDTNLRVAIKGLYAAFARYPLPDHVPGCSHCVSDADHMRLFSKPLRDLDVHDLERFAFKSMTTWGGADDFRHFLPRIFELVAGSKGWLEFVHPEIVFDKLPYADWRTWPQDEQRAILTYFEAVWGSVLDVFAYPEATDSFLCGIGQAVDDLSPYLSAWRIPSSPARALNFACFIEQNTGFPPNVRAQGRSLQNGFWKDRPLQAAQVFQWLRDPARKAELELAICTFDGDFESAAFSLESLANLEYFQNAAN
jgi:hypothetical protein